MSKGVCEERNLLHPLRKTSISCKDLINGTRFPVKILSMEPVLLASLFTGLSSSYQPYY